MENKSGEAFLKGVLLALYEADEMVLNGYPATIKWELGDYTFERETYMSWYDNLPPERMILTFTTDKEQISVRKSHFIRDGMTIVSFNRIAMINAITGKPFAVSLYIRTPLTLLGNYV